MSSYNELIKNFERIRNYMREFYVVIMTRRAPVLTMMSAEGLKAGLGTICVLKELVMVKICSFPLIAVLLFTILYTEPLRQKALLTEI